MGVRRRLRVCVARGTKRTEVTAMEKESQRLFLVPLQQGNVESMSIWLSVQDLPLFDMEGIQWMTKSPH